MNSVKVALIGTPNVGKSTLYNALTKSHEHTGNWSGKTVEYTYGECNYQDTKYIFYDLPGTYSLISKSLEEIITTDFICFNDFDVAVVVCDATNLERSINLVIQTKEICKKVVIVVNLVDEAIKKGIVIDFNKLEKNLGCKVIKTCARDKIGIDKLLNCLKDVEETEYLDINYGSLNKIIKINSEYIINDKFNKKWIALRYLENNKYYINKFENEGISFDNFKNNIKMLDINLEVVKSIKKEVSKVLDGVILYRRNNISKVDKILTSRLFGIPIMLLFLVFIFYLTIVGANYPSQLLFGLFGGLESYIVNFLEIISLPSEVIDLLVNGIYKTIYWVVSVMLPPMLIFFPLFSFLEDLGVLPRIAFNMDKAFLKCKTCGKQALTMCMGIGCNAVGVTGARIIDSKRERIIAILTNSFMPCNGKFPTLIAIITIFFVGINNNYGSIYGAIILTGIIGFGILITFLISYILSKTLLKGIPSSFTLELPAYRKPKLKNVIVNSVKTKAIYVLGRAVKASLIAGVIIWCITNIKINDISLLSYLINFFEPIGSILGVDGVIILALILGFPANEIVIPALLMCYLNTGSLIEFNSLFELKEILVSNGWTIITAICFLILMLYRFPCATTLQTIKKETNSSFYTFLGFIIPLCIGIGLCFIVNLVW